jgi:Lrp/AsnC family transcriptional regulator
MDKKDKKILAALQIDCTVSISSLAELVGLSKSACWRRIQQLEEQGIITARVALLDPRKLGLNLTVYTSIRTHQHTKQWFDRFVKTAMEIPNIMEVRRMSGDIDYLIRAVFPDVSMYDAMYKQMIEKVDLFDVSSSFSMETIKDTTGLPLDYV